jgi:hypothetical protein
MRGWLCIVVFYNKLSYDAMSEQVYSYLCKRVTLSPVFECVFQAVISNAMRHWLAQETDADGTLVCIPVPYLSVQRASLANE